MRTRKENEQNIRDNSIHIRLTTKEKKSLERKADKCGKNLSNYIRELLLEKNKKNEIVGKLSISITKLQDILNYIEEKYDCEDNEILREMVEELWKI